MSVCQQFEETTFQTECGQLLDSICANCELEDEDFPKEVAVFRGGKKRFFGARFTDWMDVHMFYP